MEALPRADEQRWCREAIMIYCARPLSHGRDYALRSLSLRFSIRAEFADHLNLVLSSFTIGQDGNIFALVSDSDDW